VGVWGRFEVGERCPANRNSNWPAWLSGSSD
jgi:hypothetical protein